MYPVLTPLTVSSKSISLYELEGEGRDGWKRVAQGDEWKSKYDMLFYLLKEVSD